MNRDDLVQLVQCRLIVWEDRCAADRMATESDPRFQRSSPWRLDVVACGLALVIMVSTGCGRDSERQAISDSTMVDLLVELHLANARIEITDRPLPIPRDSILAAYGADSAAYAQTLEHYAEHPDLYSRIYGDVLDRLRAERRPYDDSALPDTLPP